MRFRAASVSWMAMFCENCGQGWPLVFAIKDDRNSNALPRKACSGRFRYDRRSLHIQCGFEQAELQGMAAAEKNIVSVKQALVRQRGGRQHGHRARLGAHAARFEGRPFVRQCQRRLVLRSDPGRRAGRPCQLRRRDHAADRRLRGHRDRRARALAGQGPGVRDPGEGASKSSAGSTIRKPTRSSPSSTRSNSCAKSRTCARARTSSAPSRACATRSRSAIHRYFDQNGFFWINTPIITTSDAEGAGQMFRVSTLDLMNLPRTDKTGAIDFQQDFFGQAKHS